MQKKPGHYHLHLYKKKLNKQKFNNFSWTLQRTEIAWQAATPKPGDKGESIESQPRCAGAENTKTRNCNFDELLVAEWSLVEWETPGAAILGVSMALWNLSQGNVPGFHCEDLRNISGDLTDEGEEQSLWNKPNDQGKREY